jgi:predicted acyltransferase
MTALLTRPHVTDKPYKEIAPPAPSRPDEKPPRLVSLDAYRGFIMLAMASSGLYLWRVAQGIPQDDPLYSVWQFLGFHTDHVAWVGGGFWDMIQPSFMFMVGVAIPYSYASRKAKGQSEPVIWFIRFGGRSCSWHWLCSCRRR